MRLVLAAVAVALPLLSAKAHADPLQHARHIQHARQAAPPPPPSPSPPAISASGSTSAPAVSAPSAPVVGTSPSSSQQAVSNPSSQSGGVSAPPGSLASGATTVPAVSTPPSVSFTLLATNPTAVPLASIIANPPSAATSPLASTPAAGSVPSSIPNAPPLPDISSLNPANYPPLDKVPDVNSAQVQQWKQEVLNSGIPIPNIPPTVPGGCPTNPEAAADMSRCWWTCGGCVRPTDIVDCPDKLHWGLTYDDGPGFYTTELLDYLDEVNLKGTFFVIGSRGLSLPHVARYEYMSGHQLGVHTWSHPSLTGLTTDQVIAELGWARQLLRDILGVTPNTMRPPFGDIDDRVRAISLALGMYPVMWSRTNATFTYDTGDFNVNGGSLSVSQVLQNWDNIMASASASDHGFILLQHDLFQDTVEIATGYVIPDALKRGTLTIQPVAECNSRGLSNSYVETNDNKTFPPPSGPGALNATSTGGSGGSGSSQGSGATESLHINGAAVVLTILVGVLANMLTVL